MACGCCTYVIYQDPVPPVGFPIGIDVQDSSWVTIGMILYIFDPQGLNNIGYYEVIANPNNTNVIVASNLGYPGNAPLLTPILPGYLICLSGYPGSGSTGSQGSGYQGFQGPTGSQGFGSTGLQGFQGFGSTGSQGTESSNSLTWFFDNTTNPGDLGNLIGYDNSGLSDVVSDIIYLDISTASYPNNLDVTSWLVALDNLSGLGNIPYLKITNLSDHSQFGIFSVSDAFAGTGFYGIVVSFIVGNGNFGGEVSVSWVYNGIDGPQGGSGSTGLQGFQGFGSTGLQGFQGNIGSTGLQGFQGNIGSTGLQGFQGNIGSTGLQGNSGLQGSTGLQGSYGLQGRQGFQGFQGRQGFQGSGSTGLQGFQGNSGPQGSQGSGSTGLQGFQGNSGPQGSQGFGSTGLQGNSGSTGAQGFQGNIGSTGFQGNTGLQGPQGVTGSTGFQGFQGSGSTGLQGSTGSQGLQGFQGSGIVFHVNQTSHGFIVGNILMHNGTGYAKSQADSVINAEAIGIVDQVSDVNNFRILFSGIVTLSGLTAGTVYFLSASASGQYTATEPTLVGQVSKPLFIALSATQAIWKNYRGIIY